MSVHGCLSIMGGGPLAALMNCYWGCVCLCVSSMRVLALLSLQNGGLRWEAYWSESLINLVWGGVNRLAGFWAIPLLLHNRPSYRPADVHRARMHRNTPARRHALKVIAFLFCASVWQGSMREAALITQSACKHAPLFKGQWVQGLQQSAS